MQINAEDFRTIKATYYRIALDLIEAYYNDALMNGLKLDRHSEEQAVELFADNLMVAGRAFLEHPGTSPSFPAGTGCRRPSRICWIACTRPWSSTTPGMFEG